MARILIPLPHYGFDPSEAAIPWNLARSAGHKLIFATPEGKVAKGDERMLTGRGLGPFKKILMARKDALSAYREMTASREFLQPLSYSQINPDALDALLLPGGHDKSVREYLESEILQALTANFFGTEKPVGAICHGVLLAARSRNPDTGSAPIYHKRTTALLRKQERAAYQLTRWWLGDYYLTYPGLTVQDEVMSSLESPLAFEEGPLPLSRDRSGNLSAGFCVRDGNYVSARWPGDIYTFSSAFLEIIREYEGGKK